MSASRDESQKIAFVYSNLYQLYQKGKAAAKEASVPEEGPVVIQKAQKPLSQSSSVLKTEDLNQVEKAAVKVSSYNPTEFIGKRVARPEAISTAKSTPAAPKEAIVSLKANLKALNDLHARLRFMLQELEDLVKN